jgi:prefoldin alpha subunit
MSSEEEQQVQTLIADLRILEAYHNELTTRQSLLAKATIESRNAVEAIKSLLSTGSAELLVPVGGGIFMKANSPPPDKLMISVGADVVIETSKDQAIRLEEERVKSYQEGLASIDQQRRNLETQITGSRAALSRLAEKLQRASG